MKKWWAANVNILISAWEEIPDIQSKYQFEVSDDGSFAGPDIIWDSGEIAGEGNEVTIPPSALPDGAKYWVRPSTWDDEAVPVKSEGVIGTFELLSDGQASVVTEGGMFSTVTDIEVRTFLSAVHWNDGVPSVWVAQLIRDEMATDWFDVTDIEIADGVRAGYTKVSAQADITAPGQFSYNGITLAVRFIGDVHPGQFEDSGVSAISVLRCCRAGSGVVTPAESGRPVINYRPIVLQMPGTRLSLSDLGAGTRGTPKSSLVLDNADGMFNVALGIRPAIIGASGMTTSRVDEFNGEFAYRQKGPYIESIEEEGTQWFLHGARIVTRKIAQFRDGTFAPASTAQETFRGKLVVTDKSFAKVGQLSFDVQPEESLLRQRFLAQKVMTSARYKDIRNSDKGTPIADCLVWQDDFFLRAPVSVLKGNPPTSVSLRLPNGIASVTSVELNGTPIPKPKWTFASSSSTLKFTEPLHSKVVSDAQSGEFLCNVDTVRDAVTNEGMQELLVRLGVPLAEIDATSFAALRRGLRVSRLNYTEKVDGASAMYELEITAQAHVVRWPGASAFRAIESRPQFPNYPHKVETDYLPSEYDVVATAMWDYNSGLLSPSMIFNEGDLVKYTTPKPSVSMKHIARHLSLTTQPGRPRSPDQEPRRERDEVRNWWYWRDKQTREIQYNATSARSSRFRLEEEPAISPTRRIEAQVGTRGAFCYPGRLFAFDFLRAFPDNDGSANYDTFICESHEDLDNGTYSIVGRWVGRADNPLHRRA